MTPKGRAWAAAARSVRCGGVPSSEAREMLLRLLVQEAEGVPGLSMAQLAHALRWDPRKVSRALHEIEDYGLVVLPPNPDDGRRVVPEVAHAAVEAWAKGGELVLRIGAENACSFGTDFGPDTYENCTDPRVRAVPAVGVDARMQEAVAQQARAAAELEERLQRSLQVLKTNGIRMPFSMQVRLRGWLLRGLAVEDVQYAAEQTALKGLSAFGYVETILQRLWDEAKTELANVVQMAGRERSKAESVGGD